MRSILYIPIFILSYFSLIFTAQSESEITIRQSLWKAFDTFDPAYTTNSENVVIAGNLFAPLVRLSSDGKAVPGAAESWSLSEDQKTYTFKIKEGLTWSDGHPVTANDFALAYTRIFDPKVNMYKKPSYLLTSIKSANEVLAGKSPISDLGIKVIDSHTLQIELESPVSFFPSILTYPGLASVPSHKVEQLGEKWSTTTPLVTNGPLTLEDRTDSKLLMRVTADKLKEFGYHHHEIVFYSDGDKAVQDFAQGHLDLAQDLSRKQDGWLKEKHSGKFVEESLSGTIYVAINTKNEILSDPNVRRALALAVDKEFAAKRLGYNADQAAKTFTPVSLRNFPIDNKNPSKDLNISERQKLAKELLQQAGFTKDNPLKLDLLIQNKYEIERLGRILISMWGAIGVEVNGINVTKLQLNTEPLVKNYDLAIRGWFADYPEASTFLSILTEHASFNTPQWDNRAYNENFNNAITELDEDKRGKIYSDMEAIIASDTPIIPIFYPTATYLISDKIDHIIYDGDVHVTASDLVLKNQ